MQMYFHPVIAVVAVQRAYYVTIIMFLERLGTVRNAWGCGLVDQGDPLGLTNRRQAV